MPKKRFSDEQIAFALRQAEAGTTVGEIVPDKPAQIQGTLNPRIPEHIQSQITADTWLKEVLTCLRQTRGGTAVVVALIQVPFRIRGTLP